MLYLLAIVGLVALTTLFWRAFGPETTTTAARRVRGPDDDPEFLRRLDPGTSGRPRKDPGPPQD